MIKKALLFLFFFYFLTLIQSSFLVQIVPLFPNLSLVAVGIINLVEEQKKKTGLLAALFAGFFLDIFSEQWFGYYILISLLVALVFKLIVRSYIQPQLRL